MFLSGIVSKIVLGVALAGACAWLIYEVTGLIPTIKRYVAKKKANKERKVNSLENATDECSEEAEENEGV